MDFGLWRTRIINPAASPFRGSVGFGYVSSCGRHTPPQYQQARMLTAQFVAPHATYVPATAVGRYEVSIGHRRAHSSADSRVRQYHVLQACASRDTPRQYRASRRG
eukprot:850431-Rhodomonas_salina.1